MAKLLFITQKLDQEDDLLGFVTRWVNKFSKKLEKVTVICLEKGDYDLSGVRVLSLGKEKSSFKISRLLRFYKFIFSESKNYDSVFVHMNPVYVVLGGLFWRLTGKKVLLWYTHPRTTFRLRLAVFLADKIVTAVKNSFPIPSLKVVPLGHGIDTDFFRRTDVVKIPNSILSLGRISEIKRLDLLVESLNILRKDSIDFKCTVVGDSLGGKKSYYDQITKMVKENNLENHVIFRRAVSNKETPPIYNEHEVFVNLTPAGSFDKAILEAMSCESVVITTNTAFATTKGIVYSGDSAPEVAVKFREVFGLSDSARKELGRDARDFVVENHNLDKMSENLIKLLS